MKPKILKLSLVVLFFLLLGAGCDKDEPLETDPSKIILGKWEMVEIGNYPNMKPVESPSGYKEYLSDSVLKVYEYETDNYSNRKYWVDTLLHEAVFYQGEQVLTLTFLYNFPDNNTLDIETYNMPSIFNSEKYKRIN